MKVLSVIVPAYNVEKYINRCLDSLVYNEKCLDDIETIVVDDGSLDDTYKIVKNYEKKYPGSVRVIRKENGGHGSTINVGLELASGSYVKVLDGDDWFNIFDMPEFINKLSNESADIVVTNYKRVLLYEEKEKCFNFSRNVSSGGSYKISDAVEEINGADFFFKFSMPSMAIKTEVLKKAWGEGLPEKRFYVDQLFVAKVLMAANTYAVYNLDIYRHFIGRSDQSIGVTGFYNHRFDHEFVLKILLSMYNEIQDESKKDILRQQLVLMIETQYKIYCHRRGLMKKDRKELLRFDKFLKTNYDEIYKIKTVSISMLRRIR